MNKRGTRTGQDTCSLKARWVLPADQGPLDGGAVTIQGNRIVAVGTRPPEGTDVYDLGDVALMPGLINAHTHLEFSDLDFPLGQPGMPLVDWIRLVLRDRKRTNRGPSEAVDRGLSESLRRGVTTIGEISTDGSPMETAPFRSGLSCFLEVIGFSNVRADSALTALRQRLADIEESLPQAQNGAELQMPVGISPHSPYTVGVDLLDRLVVLAVKQKRFVAMHIAESQEELRLLDCGDGPFRDLLEERSMWDSEAIPAKSRPLDYLERLAAAPRAVVIHGNYLANDELAYLAARRDRMSLVYCPRTHAFFQHATYPLALAIELGVRVALGTDSRASNPDLCLLSEMRTAYRRHPGVAPKDILRMGTTWAAEALGVDNEVGSLTPGKLSNVVAVRLDGDASSNPLENFLENREPPMAVWLRGTRCLDQGTA